ncbi:hypothetical protein AWE51_16880 [Aquimarina aggregata]|uniref:Uncharacterized protein n=1 Tax=Aquimarina aggregata TaxID=1642818 RepID=A0A163D5T3_9FLAO|nr:hypothetical protein [Aquimarina aggregata]KZS43017.1 hypothetical protein AWE51_16880 [Aquimarina aggregata]
MKTNHKKSLLNLEKTKIAKLGDMASINGGGISKVSNTTKTDLPTSSLECLTSINSGITSPIGPLTYI